MSHSLDPKVRISVDLPTELPAVLIDRNQLELALLNLGLNARDAMPKGGELVIKARTVGAAHIPEKLAPGRVRSSEGRGHRSRNGRRDVEARFGALLLDQADRQGLRSRAFHGPRADAPVWRSDEMTSRPNEGTAVSLWLPVAPESLLESLKPQGAR